MLRSFVFAALLVSTGATVAGCATAGPAKQSTPTAKRLYNVGEERFAAGEPEQAVQLWRHAITQLPPTKDFDALRHELILRLAFGQIVSYHHGGKLVHLFDAKRMLERYLVAHEGLFGEAEKAKAERGEVYEILFEVERRIEDPPVDVAATSAVAMVEPRGDGTAAGGTAPGDDPNATTAAQGASPAATTTLPRKSRRRAREDAEGNDRVVVVDTRDRPSVDDPAMLKKLKKWGPEDGLVLTAPSVVPWLPARAYVRIDGLAHRLDEGEGRKGAQSVASAVIRSVRPALRACYDGAFARAPADYALATVEFAVDADGAVQTPRIVDGMVGDALGDVCVLERLADAYVGDDENVEPMRLAVNLMFFFDDAVMMNEGNSRTVRNDLDLAVDGIVERSKFKRRGRGPGFDVPRNLPPITR